MVKTVYTTFDGARFDDIEKAKQHEQEKVENSAILALGKYLHQLKMGEALSLNRIERGIPLTYGDILLGKTITGFGQLNTIAIKVDNLFLAGTFNTKFNSLTVRISWYEGGQYSVSCELGNEGLRFVQSLESNEDLDEVVEQMQIYLSDEVYEVLKKAYKGDL